MISLCERGRKGRTHERWQRCPYSMCVCVRTPIAWTTRVHLSYLAIDGIVRATHLRCWILPKFSAIWPIHVLHPNRWWNALDSQRPQCRLQGSSSRALQQRLRFGLHLTAHAQRSKLIALQLDHLRPVLWRAFLPWALVRCVCLVRLCILLRDHKFSEPEKFDPRRRDERCRELITDFYWSSPSYQLICSASYMYTCTVPACPLSHNKRFVLVANASRRLPVATWLTPNMKWKASRGLY